MFFYIRCCMFTWTNGAIFKAIFILLIDLIVFMYFIDYIQYLCSIIVYGLHSYRTVHLK